MKLRNNRVFQPFGVLITAAVVLIGYIIIASQERADKADIVKNVVEYEWEDVRVINAYLDGNYSVHEVKEISKDMKYDVYYKYNTKKYPVCCINYFTDKTKINLMSDPWEVEGWKYQYVINKKMGKEFLYTVSDGKIKRIQ